MRLPTDPGRLVSLVSTGWLLVVCSFIAWAMAPAAVLGWTPSVVVTGSMLPLVRPGDVLLVEPLAEPAGLRRGQVVLVRDATVPTGRVAHRVVGVGRDGLITTKGDANPSADSTRHAPGDVIGVARLLVPTAGRLMLLRTDPTPAGWAWAGITAAAMAGLALTRRHSRG